MCYCQSKKVTQRTLAAKKSGSSKGWNPFLKGVFIRKQPLAERFSKGLLQQGVAPARGWLFEKYLKKGLIVRLEWGFISSDLSFSSYRGMLTLSFSSLPGLLSPVVEGPGTLFASSNDGWQLENTLPFPFSADVSHSRDAAPHPTQT